MFTEVRIWSYSGGKHRHGHYAEVVLLEETFYQGESIKPIGRKEIKMIRADRIPRLIRWMFRL
jgi:hypothetical protein